jgi:DNA polymerase sigma
VLALDKARIPVLKFTVPSSGTKVDITINNELPLHNTRLLKAYADIDPRVRQLIVLVKYWAKVRNVNNAYHGTLSSYAWVLLCIFVVQRAGIVPVLQLPSEVRLDVDKKVVVDGQEWVVRYASDIHTFQKVAQMRELPLAGLVTMFFDYFANRCASTLANCSSQNFSWLSSGAMAPTDLHLCSTVLLCISHVC